MLEIRGELWDYYKVDGHTICLTVNGTIKANGAAVMGRGCALEATNRFNDIGKVWGKRLKDYGLKFMYLHEFDLFMFPVKYNWWERASFELIKESAVALKKAAETQPFIFLPRPGCGNGKLEWRDVKAILEEVGLPDNIWVISR